MINIIGKSIVEENQLLKSYTDGFKCIELQLFKEVDTTSTTEYMHTIKEIPGLDIYSVHTPLLGYDEIAIEDFVGTKHTKYILRTMDLAEQLALHYNHDVNVVVHTSTNVYTLQKYVGIWDTLLQNLTMYLDTYPNTTISIENTTPLHSGNKQGKDYPIFHNGSFYDNVEIVKTLREALPDYAHRIFSLLDICHALTTVRTFNVLNTAIKKVDVSISKFIEVNAPYCHHIHFNNLRNLGWNPDEHGCGFEDTQEDLDLLKEICTALEKFMPNAPCVFEMCEKDYIYTPNANKLKTIDGLTKLGFNYHIVQKTK